MSEIHFSQLSQHHLFMRNQPTDVLPSEVLSVVFLWGLPNSKYRFKVDRYRRSISQVCRSWRIICLDTPRLWRAIYVINDGFYFHHDWIIMKSLIGRAAMVPLDLTIHISSISDAALHLLRCLKPYIRQLRELHFTSVSLDQVLEFFPLPRSMPYLKTLDICLTGPFRSPPIELWRPDSSFPALKSFTIDLRNVAARFSFQSIPCDQVLDLNIFMNDFRDKEHVKYIKNFKRLQSMGLHLYYPEMEVPEPLPPFPHGSLHSLKLGSSTDILPPTLMADTSSIRHLELTTAGNPLGVSESKDFPCLRTISHPTKCLYHDARVDRFIRDHPSIFAIEIHRQAAWFLDVLFSEELISLQRPHNVRFVRFLVSEQSSGVEELRKWLRSKWAPRFEWVFLDVCRSASNRSLNIYERIRVFTEEFPNRFRWMEDNEAIPMDDISSLDADGWPIREEFVEYVSLNISGRMN